MQENVDKRITGRYLSENARIFGLRAQNLSFLHQRATVNNVKPRCIQIGYILTTIYNAIYICLAFFVLIFKFALIFA